MAQEKKPSFGSYELRDGVNSLSFGSDPLVTLKAGKSFTAKDEPTDLFLKAHPDVKRAKTTSTSSAGKGGNS